MVLIVLVFLLALGLAAVLGMTTDSRDGADWRTHAPGDPDRLHRAGR